MFSKGDKVTLTVGDVTYDATVLEPGEVNSLIRIEDGSGHEMEFWNERLTNG